ncbi:pentatricopeptide repeat-containing protein At1g11900 isoform X2 [Cryptomeria japonica]|uniref:pentatricopeptide repeat-containing protein At1g11900 isoform X2 n=1 Tax=Cryptomeria japonica TaxID=3369 RepID=UPI0025AD885A|nr:pentatricopeptide repeat-containing protein At1g11900 isoform X2 [Cryptomeria japonica]
MTLDMPGFFLRTPSICVIQGSVINVKVMTRSCSTMAKIYTGAIDEMHNLGKIPDDATLSVLADFLVKEEKEVPDALGQLIPDFENNLSASTKITLVLIENFIKVNKLFSAFFLLRELRNRGVVPDLAVYSSLLIAVGKASDFKLACQIFKDLLANGSSDSASYFALSKALAKVADKEVAYKFCMELAEDSFLCNATVLNRLIYAFAGTGQLETAVALFEYMKHCKHKPDQVTYNTIIDVLGKSGHGDITYHEFLSMKELGHDPDIITYNTLINNFCRLGRLDLCLIVLKEMIARGFEPNLRIYTALIDRFGRIGQVDEAMRLFIDMKKRGCRASVYVYRSLISTLRKAGKVEIANKLSEEMNESSSNLIGPGDFKKKRR